MVLEVLVQEVRDLIPLVRQKIYSDNRGGLEAVFFLVFQLLPRFVNLYRHFELAFNNFRKLIPKPLVFFVLVDPSLQVVRILLFFFFFLFLFFTQLFQNFFF
jgi:hypothetical protein